MTIYGSETWTLAKAEEKRLLTFEAWCWRSMQRISWKGLMANEQVFTRAEERKCFMKSLKERRIKQIGHN